MDRPFNRCCVSPSPSAPSLAPRLPKPALLRHHPHISVSCPDPLSITLGDQQALHLPPPTPEPFPSLPLSSYHCGCHSPSPLGSLAPIPALDPMHSLSPGPGLLFPGIMGLPLSLPLFGFQHRHPLLLEASPTLLLANHSLCLRSPLLAWKPLSYVFPCLCLPTRMSAPREQGCAHLVHIVSIAQCPARSRGSSGRTDGGTDGWTQEEEAFAAPTSLTFLCCRLCSASGTCVWRTHLSISSLIY